LQRSSLASPLFPSLLNLSCSSLRQEPAQQLIAGVPRIYSSFSPFDSGEPEKQLTINQRLQLDDYPRSLLFLASVEGSENPYFVKLVNSGYGADVHLKLAASDLAPRLYGRNCPDGALGAYIMEYLTPPSLGAGGWVTLFKFAQDHQRVTTEHKDAIRCALDRALTVLETNNFVYGDLRSNNVMVEVDEHGQLRFSSSARDVKIRLVDCDWAGVSGKVCYPLLLNHEICWPGAPGTAILVGHDRTLVDSWWPDLFLL